MGNKVSAAIDEVYDFHTDISMHFQVCYNQIESALFVITQNFSVC